MSNFKRTITTQKGHELMAKMLTGVTINFTRITTSEHEYSILEDFELEALTIIENEKQSVLVSDIELTNESYARVHSVITNTELIEGYYVKAICLYANDPSEGEILYSITVCESGKADWFPPFNEHNVSSIEVNLDTVISNADNVSLEVNPAALISVKTFNKFKDEITSQMNEKANETDNTRTTTSKTVTGAINELNSNKRDSATKIKSSDLDTSSNANKIGIINLADEVIETIANPLTILYTYPDGGIQLGRDISGTVDVSASTPNRFLVNTTKIDLSKGTKIALKTNFACKVLVYSYNGDTGLGFIDFANYVQGSYINYNSSATAIRITIAHADDTDIVTSTDTVEFYQGGGTLLYTFTDGSVTTEKIADLGITTLKIADANVTNKKLTQSISKIVPWSNNISVTPGTSATDTEVVTIPASSIFSSCIGKYAVQSSELSLSIPDGSLCYLLWDDTVSANPLPSSSFVVSTVTSFTPAYNKHILFFNYSGKLVSPIAIYQNKLDRIYNGVNLGYKNVVVVAKSGGDYTNINDAVTNANDSADNPVTILVMPGTYKEVVNIYGNRHISIVGINKKDCILRYDSGKYSEAPLRIEGQAYIANMTIISTHDDDAVTPVDSLRAYAVHCDDAGAGITEFNNCILISYQNAALGSGLHQDQTLKLVNCELYSHTPSDSTMTVNGALFCHSNVTGGVTNQNLIVKNCIIKSDLSYAAYINDANKTAGDALGNIMNVTFYNNMIYSNALGKTGVIHKESLTTGNISGCINLTTDSYGNNISELNA